MKRLKIISTILAVILGVVGCSSSQADRPTPEQASAPAASDALPIGAALAQTGYLATPMHRQGDYRFVQTKIATKPLALLLDSGSPFDLLLDSSLELGEQAGVHITDVLSGYWTFTDSPGHWATVDRLAFGASVLEALEAKVEPSPLPVTRALLGATALISRGAIIDYATDTLYLLAPHLPPAPVQQPGVRHPTLRAALEHAGQYRTFLALMQQAGLLSLLDSTTGSEVTPDSIVWLGLRIQAAQISGVGAMPPNDVHLQLARGAVEQWRRGSRRRTVFAPTDTAFARLPAETLRALRADTAHLARLLRAHLYLGAAIDTTAIRTLIRGAAQPGPDRPAFGFHVLGPRIDVDRLSSWEEGRVVSRATVVQPDLQTAHGIAVAHGIDRVLGPFTAQSPIAEALARQGYIGIPLYRREDGNGYLVHAAVNDVPVRLTIATGAPLELALDQQWANRLPRSRGRDYLVAFDSVRLGSVDVKTVDFSGPIQSVQRQGYRTDAGIVGSLLLAKYHARIDYAAGMLYLRLPAATPTAGSAP